MCKVFENVIGIVGHPTTPDVAWSDEQLRAIRDIGVDTLQLSIAWSSKPANEVLNLEDLDDPATAAVYKDRVRKAHRHGFSALGHFGVPRADPVRPWPHACIMEPTVMEAYRTRVTNFFAEYDADAAMIYTYDQRAWLCSEFGECPNCRGVPLHERLTPFLESLVDAAGRGKPGARLWWEPWELSEGQIIRVVEKIQPAHFGVIMHSNIGEVHFSNVVDQPSRTIARIAKNRGIPVVLEGFFGGSGEEVTSLTHIPCPRLVHQQLDSMRRTYGVTGVKEYYGFVPAEFSVNVGMFSSYLRSPDSALDELLEHVAQPYGEAALMRDAWELVSQGLEIFPYNASWGLRFLVSDPDVQTWRRLKPADWETPSWKASRRAYYMVTNDVEQHPWLLEDVALRAHTASDRVEQAVSLLERAERTCRRTDDVRLQKQNLIRFQHASRRFARSMGG